MENEAHNESMNWGKKIWKGDKKKSKAPPLNKEDEFKARTSNAYLSSPYSCSMGMNNQ